MALGVKVEIRNGWLDDLITAIGNAGKIKFYDGTRPSTGGTATTLLSTIILGSPAAGAASDGSVTLSGTPLEDADAAATGTASWARITTSADVFVADCDVSVTGGAGDIQLNSVSITEGGIVRITAGTISAGNA